MSRSLSPTELKRLHRTWRRQTDLDLAVICDGVQNPFNVGTIIRSAAAYNSGSLWAVPPTPSLQHPKVAKTALGCERLITMAELPTGPDAVAAARDAGFKTVAVELAQGAQPIFEVDLGPRVCVVVGHEERGVHRDTLAAVDAVAFVPQLGKVGSLNVAQAATLAFYEAARQRWAAGD